MKVVALVSGGMDSVVMAHMLASQRHDIHIVAANYGQRHRKELDFAQACAMRIGARIDVADLSSLKPLLAGSALTDDVAVPDGHYTDASMSSTVVPNRNAILLSVAFAAAVSGGAHAVAYAAHSGDHPIYPDCRPSFINAFALAMYEATSSDIALVAPFQDRSKADICRQGAQLGVPFGETWSCYRGGEIHCGTCGTCVERREAFALAGVPDPTEYAA